MQRGYLHQDKFRIELRLYKNSSHILRAFIHRSLNVWTQQKYEDALNYTSFLQRKLSKGWFLTFLRFILLEDCCICLTLKYRWTYTKESDCRFALFNKWSTPKSKFCTQKAIAYILSLSIKNAQSLIEQLNRLLREVGYYHLLNAANISTIFETRKFFHNFFNCPYGR